MKFCFWPNLTSVLYKGCPQLLGRWTSCADQRCFFPDPWNRWYVQAFLCIYYLSELPDHDHSTAWTGKQVWVSKFTWSAIQRKFRDLMGRKRQAASQRQQTMLDILTLPRHSDSWSCDPLSVLQQMVIRSWCTEVLLLLYMERGN